MKIPSISRKYKWIFSVCFLIFTILFNLPLNDGKPMEDTPGDNGTSIFSKQLLDRTGFQTSTGFSSTESSSRFQITTEQTIDRTTFSYSSTTSLSINEWINRRLKLDTHDALELLIQFLELQNRACPYVRLCTLDIRKSKHVADIRAGEKECCHRCSCSESCVEKNDCCPDYYLYTLLNNRYKGFDGLKNALTNENVTSIYDKSISEVDSRNQTKFECVKTDLKSIMRGFVPASDYILITTCSPTYPADQTRHKCENNISNETATVTDYIPVYSTNTSKSYKNIHCLICNGLSPNSSIAWQGSLRCLSHNYSTLPFFTNVNRLIQYMLKDDNALPKCNIVFEPLTGFATEPCTFVTRSTCTRKPAGQAVAQWSVLRQMCEQFVLPVDRINKTIDTYRNIACLYCNHGPYFKDKCKDVWKVNQMYDMVIDPNYLKTTEYEIENTLNKTFNKNGECKTGYIQNMNKECSQVLCPRGMYVSKGRCVLMFNTLSSQIYSCIFKIKPLYRGYKLDKIPENYIEKSVVKLLFAYMDKLRIEKYSDAALFYFQSRKLFLFYIILKDFNRIGPQYALDKFSQLNRELSNGILKIDRNTIRIRSEIFSDAHVRPDGYLDMYDFKNNYRPYTIFEIHNANSQNQPAMPITRAHFCYRIRLDKENVTNDKHFIKINGLETEIPKDDVEFDSKDEKPISCIKLSTQTNAQIKNKDGKFRDSKRYRRDMSEKSSYDFEKGIYPIAIIVGLIVLTLALRKVFNSRFHEDICKSD